MQMSFGKYKGNELDQIPKGYLKWVMANCSINDELKSAIEAITGPVAKPLSDEEKLIELCKQYEKEQAR